MEDQFDEDVREEPVEGPKPKPGSGEKWQEKAREEYLKQMEITAVLEGGQGGALRSAGDAVQKVAVGVIKAASLPAGWVIDENTNTSRENRNSTSAFRPPVNNSDARIAFHDRNIQLSENSADALQQTLGKIPHPIVKDGSVLNQSERKGLEQVLGNMNDPTVFDLKHVSTATLNGKNVLIVEGQWKASCEHYTGVIFPTDGSGNEVQEVFFSGSKTEYEKYASIARKCFGSIEWQPKKASSEAR